MSLSCGRAEPFQKGAKVVATPVMFLFMSAYLSFPVRDQVP